MKRLSEYAVIACSISLVAVCIIAGFLTPANKPVKGGQATCQIKCFTENGDEIVNEYRPVSAYSQCHCPNGSCIGNIRGRVSCLTFYVETESL